MTTSSPTQPVFLRPWLLWTVGFLAFPIAGLAGTAVVGRVDDALAAMIGGAVCGLVIGTGQVLTSRRLLAVVAHGGARVGVAGGDLDVAEVDAG